MTSSHITFSPNTTETFEMNSLDFLPEAVQKVVKLHFGDDVSFDTLKQEKLLIEDEELFEYYEIHLPKELIQKTKKKVSAKNGSILDCYVELTNLIEKRANTWEINGEEPHKEELLRTITTLSAARYDSNLFLGRGNAAHVFEAPNAGGYCIKFLYNSQMQRTTIEEEFIILHAANSATKNAEALRTPQVHGIAKNIEQTKNFFTMEKITGVTLTELTEAPSKRAERIPAMTLEKVIERLKDKNLRTCLKRDLEKIHSAGIIHGDIHPRNIMLDNDGNFYLIDFGNSYVTVNIPVAIDYDNIENRKELDIKTFINSLDQTLATLLKEQQDLTKVD